MVCLETHVYPQCIYSRNGELGKITSLVQPVQSVRIYFGIHSGIFGQQERILRAEIDPRSLDSPILQGWQGVSQRNVLYGKIGPAENLPGSEISEVGRRARSCPWIDPISRIG